MCTYFLCVNYKSSYSYNSIIPIYSYLLLYQINQSAHTLGKETFFLYNTNSAKTIDGVTAIFAI